MILFCVSIVVVSVITYFLGVWHGMIIERRKWLAEELDEPINAD